jgi:hypothetical protein
VTWIVDDNGTRWVDVTRHRKTRKSPRAIKFAALKVGDQIMQKPRPGFYRGIATYYVVTDIWFDPVAGQDNEAAGTMVGFAQVKSDGTLSRKRSTPIRGLASQQYDYADKDYVGLATARAAAMKEPDGAVVGIGYARTIRQRPKIAGL